MPQFVRRLRILGGFAPEVLDTKGEKDSHDQSGEEAEQTVGEHPTSSLGSGPQWRLDHGDNWCVANFVDSRLLVRLRQGNVYLLSQIHAPLKPRLLELQLRRAEGPSPILLIELFERVLRGGKLSECDVEARINELAL